MVSVFIVVISAVSSAFRENRARQSAIAATDAAHQVVRSTVSMIRQATPSATGSYPIQSATSTELVFYAPVAGTTTIQRARLFISNGKLQLGTTQPGSPATYSGTESVTTLLSGVVNGATPLFQYYDASYTGTGAAMNPVTLSAIRLIKMTIIFDDNPNAPPLPSTIELLAQLRNLKDNL